MTIPISVYRLLSLNSPVTDFLFYLFNIVFSFIIENSQRFLYMYDHFSVKEIKKELGSAIGN